jgi:pheromone shutdown protein TraB
MSFKGKLNSLSVLLFLFELVVGRRSRQWHFPPGLALLHATLRGGGGVIEGHSQHISFSRAEDGTLAVKRDAFIASKEEEQVNSRVLGDFADALNHDNLKSQTNQIPPWKASLPVPLCSKGHQALQKLCIAGNIDIYLLGTAHVSNDSSADVQLLLSHIDPDCIFVELCEARMSLLENHHSDVKNDAPKEENPTPKTDKASWRERLSRRGTKHQNHSQTTNSSPGTWFQTMSAALLTRVQEDYAEKLGVELGGEFKCAHSFWRRKQEARRVLPLREVTDRRPHLILGDRPVQLTLVRAWESLSFWAKVKVCVGLLWSSLPFGKPNVEELRAWLASVMQTDGADILTQSLEELRRYFPTLYTTIIAERDAWLAAKLIQTCRALNQPQSPEPRSRQTIVAIVGAGHVPGIVQWLTTRTTQTPEQVLSTLVTTQRWAKDETVQQTMTPNWIHDVVTVQDMV